MEGEEVGKKDAGEWENEAGALGVGCGVAEDGHDAQDMAPCQRVAEAAVGAVQDDG